MEGWRPTRGRGGGARPRLAGILWCSILGFFVALCWHVRYSPSACVENDPSHVPVAPQPHRKGHGLTAEELEELEAEIQRRLATPEPTLTPTPTPTFTQNTRPLSIAKCWRMDDWSDRCYYENLCYNKDHIFLLVDDNPRHQKNVPRPQRGMSSFNPLYFDYHNYPPPVVDNFPAASQWGMKVFSLDYLGEPYGKGNVSITWLNGTSVLIAPDVHETNLWHYAVVWFPVTALKTVALGWAPENPWETKVDRYIIRRQHHGGYSGWETEFRDMIRQESPVYYKEDIPEIGPEHLQCYEKAWVFSPRPRFFQGPEECHQFRLMSYKYAGLDPALSYKHPPPFNVIIANRKGSRSIKNIDAMVAACKRLNVPCSVVDMGKGLKPQIQTISTAGVYVFIHGAAAVNSMFLPFHSAVIEIFPAYWAPNSFTQMIETCGYHHYRLYEQLPKNITILDSSPNKTQSTICAPLSRADYERKHDCERLIKSLGVWVDIGDFEKTVANAMRDIGHEVHMPDFITALVPSDREEDRDHDPWTWISQEESDT